MTSATVALVAGCLAFGVAVLPLRRSFALFVAIELLVPASIVIPNGLTSYLTIARVVAVAALVGLVRHAIAHRASPAIFRATPVHLALLFSLGVAVVAGLALSEPDVPFFLQLQSLTTHADQLLVLVVTLAYVRAINDPGFVIRVVAGAAVALAAMAGLEHVTHTSVSRWLIQTFTPQQLASRAALPLDTRAGEYRVRGSATYALELAWMLAMLAPFVIVAVAVVRRRMAWAVAGGLALVAAATFWTYSRSAVVGLGAALLLTWALARAPRRVSYVVAAVAGVALVIGLATSASAPFTDRANEGTVAVRAERIPIVGSLVLDRPWNGLGLAALEVRDLPATDNYYLQTYGEQGVAGVVALVLLLGAAFACVAPGLAAPAGPDRLLGAAATAAVLVAVAGAGAHDLFALQGSVFVFWLLVGCGIGTGEAVWGVVAPAIQRPTAARAGAIAIAALLGVAVFAVTPRHASEVDRYALVSTAEVARSTTALSLGTHVLRDLACAVVEAQHASGVSISCGTVRADDGLVEVQVAGHSTAAVRRAAAAVDAQLSDRLPRSRRHVLRVDAGLRPVWAQVAPIGAAAIAAALALSMPTAWPRRRPALAGAL